MDKRIRIGIIYIWDNNWLGGKYYLQNLLVALNTLSDEKKPVVNLYCLNDTSFVEFQKNTGYPYLVKSIVKENKIFKILRRVLFFFSKEMAIKISTFSLNPADNLVFPLFYGSDVEKMISWIPDFQEKRLPEYFSDSERRRRDYIVRSTCERGIPIVFSSYDSQNDFREFYPEYVSHPTFVVHFSVKKPLLSNLSISVLKNKYGIKKPYILCANQFWQHKNHLFLFRAFEKVLKMGIDLQLVCTGKMEDYRRPHYIDEIKTFLNINNLNDDILTLGVIDKDELICLMKNSYAVIQPSLFEGWNTTVEDCKAMNKFVFLSDIGVHREQIDKNVCFFNPRDEDDLAEKLLNVYPTETIQDYSVCVRKFGEDFYRIVESFTNNHCGCYSKTS